jgi:hypothetical protein
MIGMGAKSITIVNVICSNFLVRSPEMLQQTVLLLLPRIETSLSPITSHFVLFFSYTFYSVVTGDRCASYLNPLKTEFLPNII